MRVSKVKTVIGWCELVDVPSLRLVGVHGKMDSGARTSSIHATHVKPFEKDGQQWVKFRFRAWAGDTAHEFEAPVLEQRRIRSSNGHMQQRYVIAAELCLGEYCWQGQLTLADRGSMAFPMLIGRRSLKRGFLVDSGRRWVLGKPHDASS